MSLQQDWADRKLKRSSWGIWFYTLVPFMGAMLFMIQVDKPKKLIHSFGGIPVWMLLWTGMAIGLVGTDLTKARHPSAYPLAWLAGCSTLIGFILVSNWRAS